jgi:hypothetical protein
MLQKTAQSPTHWKAKIKQWMDDSKSRMDWILEFGLESLGVTWVGRAANP